MQKTGFIVITARKKDPSERGPAAGDDLGSLALRLKELIYGFIKYLADGDHSLLGVRLQTAEYSVIERSADRCPVLEITGSCHITPPDASIR